ncbi:TetR/AcrR family transcriptional regulator [Pseudoduganella lutea]|uniref:TetR/AcrR family transcriptional regulator n=1 Tax=Pseudoduganella lutea TaxID=321985 RepID=UPI0026B2C96F|nr:TetR/AcrR family transcriptional regulator [Pseudoduganella lutea]
MKSTTTADDILACTRSLIAAGGYNGFSYADIAGVVGIRKASIHHHFPSKVDLVRTLVAQYRKAAEEGIANLEHGISGPLDQLRAYVQYWKTCIGDATAPFCICALLAVELPMLPDDVALEVRGYFRFLSGWITSVFERGVREKNDRAGPSAPRGSGSLHGHRAWGHAVGPRLWGRDGIRRDHGPAIAAHGGVTRGTGPFRGLRLSGTGRRPTAGLSSPRQLSRAAGSPFLRHVAYQLVGSTMKSHLVRSTFPKEPP